MPTKQFSKTPVTTATPESIDARIGLLDDDARRGLRMVFEQLLIMLENNGTAVIAIDRSGEGTMLVAALGQQTMIGPLMSAIADIHNDMIEQTESPLQ
jgi:hypothetical protein